jgi:hypothetical protein
LRVVGILPANRGQGDPKRDESRHVPGGIAKAFGLDDGPTHTKAAIVKGRALGDATHTLNT